MLLCTEETQAQAAPGRWENRVEPEPETAGAPHPTVCRQLVNNENFKYLFSIKSMPL